MFGPMCFLFPTTATFERVTNVPTFLLVLIAGKQGSSIPYLVLVKGGDLHNMPSSHGPSTGLSNATFVLFGGGS